MQGRFVLKYLDILQTFLYLHLINSKHPSAASDKDIHFSTKSSEIVCHRRKLAVNISGLGMQLLAYIPACNAAFLCRWHVFVVSPFFTKRLPSCLICIFMDVCTVIQTNNKPLFRFKLSRFLVKLLRRNYSLCKEVSL